MKLYGSKPVEKLACKYGENCCAPRVQRYASKSVRRKLKKRARQLNKKLASHVESAP